MQKIKWLVCLFLFNVFFLSNVAAIEPAPCCPPGTSALSRAIAFKLKEIKNSPEYHKMQLIVFSLVILLILVIFGMLWKIKNKKN